MLHVLCPASAIKPASLGQDAACDYGMDAGRNVFGSSSLGQAGICNSKNLRTRRALHRDVKHCGDLQGHIFIVYQLEAGTMQGRVVCAQVHFGDECMLVQLHSLRVTATSVVTPVSCGVHKTSLAATTVDLKNTQEKPSAAYRLA